MKQLPKGITDFGKPEENESISELEFKLFCYKLLVEFKYVELEVIELSSGNYYLGKLKTNNKELCILMNRHYPIVGLADYYDYGIANFIDHKEICEYINSENRLLTLESTYKHYRCMSVLDLEREVDEVTLKLLDSQEIRQINYWKPQKVKDIVFNNWD
ncbi:hypothetical protein ACFO9Q_10995 [Paenibacillus sp. GCM10023252]|uniref:hypothetical protein n=1 Tax=Paenibacillus sp. GCM10023252 TaxID=3252649 RepID=UPI00361024D2